MHNMHPPTSNVALYSAVGTNVRLRTYVALLCFIVRGDQPSLYTELSALSARSSHHYDSNPTCIWSTSSSMYLPLTFTATLPPVAESPTSGTRCGEAETRTSPIRPAWRSEAVMAETVP